MPLQEKSVNQFVKEMREAGFDFEFKASNNEGLTVQSKGWIDDNRVYHEVNAATNHIQPKEDVKPRKRKY